jgi:hypothetical protein
MAAGSALAQKPQLVIGPGTGGANFRAPYHQTFNRTLSQDTIYILSGWYFVDSTRSLTIQAGTLILGDSASGGSLIISRGARIYADGTLANPIVFTSASPAGTRVPGQWGGVIVLGSAPTNKPTTQQVEGGFGTIANTNATYGGADPNDTSGVIRYVRIEYPGIAFAQDNEINGLTLGGVGAGTILDYVQVSYANDDDFEFFGGTVNGRHLVSMGQIDDTFDNDFGYAGMIQFAFGHRDRNYFDASASGSSNGFETDNEGSAPYSATPRTRPKFSNVTMVGPMSDTTAGSVNPKWERIAMIRRASELSIHNSVLMAWPAGIQLKDTLTQRAAIDGRLQIRNTSIQAPRNVLTLSSSPNTGNIAGFDVVGWFTTGTGNLGATPRAPQDLGLVNPFPLDNTVDPRPGLASEPATAGTSYAGLDPFFTPVSYRGAFDPALPMSSQWTAGWTNFDPQQTSYLTSVDKIDGTVPAALKLEQNYPNPFNPVTSIRFSLPHAGLVTLKVYNTLGQEVSTLLQEQLPAGSYEQEFSASALSSGIYFYRLTVDGADAVRKMVLLK